MSILPSVPGPIGLRDIFLRIPDQAVHLVDFYQRLLRGRAPLGAGERELIYAYCSKQAGCHFCHTSHRHCAVALGLPQAAFAVPPGRLDTAPLPPMLRDQLRFAVSLTDPRRHRARLARDAEAALRWGNAAVTDTILVTGLTAFINRLIDGLGASLPDSRHRANGLALARHGYGRVRQEVARAQRAAGLPAARALPRRRGRVPREARSRAGLLHWLAAYRAHVFEGPSGLPRALRRRIARQAARIDGGGATRAARRLAAREAPVLAFAARLSRRVQPSRPRDVAAIFRAGWSERDLIDAVLCVAAAAFEYRVAIGMWAAGFLRGAR